MATQVPSTTTAGDLAGWMSRVAGPRIVEVLGWSDPASYDDIIVDALMAYGVDDLASARDIPRLLAVARVALWQAVVEQTSGETYLAMPDGIRAYGYQINEQAQRALAAARRAAATTYGLGYAVERVQLRHRRRRGR